MNSKHGALSFNKAQDSLLRNRTRTAGDAIKNEGLSIVKLFGNCCGCLHRKPGHFTQPAPERFRVRVPLGFNDVSARHDIDPSLNRYCTVSRTRRCAGKSCEAKYWFSGLGRGHRSCLARDKAFLAILRNIVRRPKSQLAFLPTDPAVRAQARHVAPGVASWRYDASHGTVVACRHVWRPNREPLPQPLPRASAKLVVNSKLSHTCGGGGIGRRTSLRCVMRREATGKPSQVAEFPEAGKPRQPSFP